MKQHKRPIFTVIIILLLLIISCRKPTCPPNQVPITVWTKTYGGEADDHGYSVQETPGNGYIIVGSTKSFGNGLRDVFLIKTDENGDVIWTKTYGGTSEEVGYSVQLTSDGGYIIAGYTNSIGSGEYDIYMIKTNAFGNTLWEKTYGGSKDDYGLALCETSDGGFIVAGHTRSYGEGSNDIYLIRTDIHGDTLWTRTYGGSDNDCGSSVYETSDGGFIVSGYTRSYGAGGYDIYVIKTDASGNILWTKIYGEENDDFGNSIQQTSDGGYILVGTTTPSGASHNYTYLLKIAENGDIIWTRKYGESIVCEGLSVQQTYDGGYIITGYSNYVDVYIIKTDANGNTVWAVSYGGDSYDIGHSVKEVSDGGYIIVGVTSSFGFGLSDVYLIKIK